MATPRVYIVVLNWNRWWDTVECLESLFRLDYPDFRVVVCDNASADGSLERLRAWAEGRERVEAPPDDPSRGRSDPTVEKPIRFTLLDRAGAERGEGGDAPLALIQTGGNLGFAGGSNVGLRYALERGGAPYAWLVNNDTVVDPGALRALVACAEKDPRLGIVGSKVLYYDHPAVVQAVGGGELKRWQGMTRLLGRDEPDRGQWDEPRELEYVTGASMLVRLSALKTVGLMDERYFLYSEEVDWCLQMRRAGMRLSYCPDSRVWHKEGRSVGYRGPTHDYYTVRSSLLLVRKFYPHLLPLAACYSVYRCLLPKVLRLQFARLGPVLRGYRDFVRLTAWR